MEIAEHPLCPECRSNHTSRFQWVDGYGFEYWICWNCGRNFNEPQPEKKRGKPSLEKKREASR